MAVSIKESYNAYRQSRVWFCFEQTDVKREGVEEVCSPEALSWPQKSSNNKVCDSGTKEINSLCLGSAGYDLPALLNKPGSKKQQKSWMKTRGWITRIQTACCHIACEKDWTQLHHARKGGIRKAQSELSLSSFPNPCPHTVIKGLSQHWRDPGGRGKLQLPKIVRQS